MTGLILLSALVIFLDFMLLPTLVGFFNSSLSLVFLISLILYFGVTKKSLIFGVLLAVVLELISGSILGSYTISFLLTCLIVLLVSKFINMPKSIFTLSLIGSLLSYVFSFIFVLINDRALHPLQSPVLYLYYFIETFLILNLLKYVEKRI